MRSFSLPTQTGIMAESNFPIHFPSRGPKKTNAQRWRRRRRSNECASKLLSISPHVHNDYCMSGKCNSDEKQLPSRKWRRKININYVFEWMGFWWKFANSIDSGLILGRRDEFRGVFWDGPLTIWWLLVEWLVTFSSLRGCPHPPPSTRKRIFGNPQVFM